MKAKSISRITLTLRFTLLTFVLAAAVALSMGLRGEPALAQTTGPLLPTAQGSEAGWIAASGTQLGSVSQASCGAGDGTWITSTYRGSSSFTVPLDAVPNYHKITKITIRTCYADNDDTANPLQAVRPFFRVGGAEYPGAVISPAGETAVRLAVDEFHLGQPQNPPQIFTTSPNMSLEVGVRDHSFLSSATRVYALWVTIEHQAEALPSAQLLEAPVQGQEPYRPGDRLLWRVIISVPQSIFMDAPLKVAAAWNNRQIFGGPDTANCVLVGALGPEGASCGFYGQVGSRDIHFWMSVSPAATACFADFNVTVTFQLGIPFEIRLADRVALASPGCQSSATPTATVSVTASPSATLTPLPSATATPSPFTTLTATPTSVAGQTVTPTPAGSATATVGGSSTPSAFSTPSRTPAASATAGSSQLPYKLRTILVANDGGN